MIVVMRPGSSFAGDERTVVGLEGQGSDTAKGLLAALPGVEEVLCAERSGPIKTRDLRIESIRPLVPPAILLEQLPLPDAGALTVSRAREEVIRILDGQDDRLVVVVGPCSIHDHPAALEYARRLAALAEELAPDLRIVMRVY